MMDYNSKNNESNLEVQIQAADEFWAQQRERVLRVAAEHNIANFSIDEYDDSFLFDLYDQGDYIPGDDEIWYGITEYVETLEVKKCKIENLYAFLKKQNADRIIIRTTYCTGGWHDNEFDANQAGYNIHRFINPEYAARNEFAECYMLTKKK